MMNRKRKLCIIIPTHWSARMGGSQYQAKCLIDRLIPEDRFEIFYLTKRCNNRSPAHGYQIVKINEMKNISRYAFFLDTFSLLKHLNQIQPDVIYQRVGCAHTGIAAYYAKKNGSKMVWHIASDTDVLPFREAKSMKKGLNYVDKRILEYGIKSSAHIVAQTHRQSECLKKYYRREPTAVIRNFHPLPKEAIWKTGPLKLVWISNFKPLKQPESFIRLARDLRSLSGEVRFIMIGAPCLWPSGWQNALEREIHEVKNLSYLGACSLEQVNSILAEAHILVNTSLYEGFPNTFIQAWMRKVPVVSLNCNPDDVFDRNQVGFYCGTHEKMVDRVTALIRDPVERLKIGENARNFAFESYSERNMESLIELLKC